MTNLRAALFIAALALSVASVGAQEKRATGDPRLPAGARLLDLAVRIFDKSDGLESPTVYAVTVDLTGRLWIGTDVGPMRFDGDRWQHQRLTPEVPQRQTRAILQARDSSFWFATRSGVIRMRGDTQTLFDLRHGLPHSVVYSIIETSAINGTPQIIVGTGAGVAVFDGERFNELKLPDNLQPEGLMLGETRAPDGTLELWLASSLGKVGRFTKGKWTVFGAAEGLTSRSAEAIVAVHNYPNSRVLVPGDGGVFAFRDDGPRGARFERLAGSPRRSFRIAELKRVDGSQELWVGNLDGVLFRNTNAGWDTVNVASGQRGGRITALRVVSGHAGGTAVYVGTYGGRLARIAVGSVASLETQGTRRDVTLAVVPERAPSGRTEFWMGTLNAGLLHLDEHGRVTEYSRETNQSFVHVSTLALLSSVKRSASQRDTLDEQQDLWLSTDKGVYRREGSQLVPQSSGLDGNLVRLFLRAPLPDGTLNLLAATDSGVFRWIGHQWEHVRALGVAPILAMTTVTTAAGPTLWLAANHRTARVTLQRITHDVVGKGSSPAGVTDARAPSESFQQHSVSALCGLNDAFRSGRVFAGTVSGGLWWRGPNTNWAPFPASQQRHLSSLYVRKLACLDDGRLVVGLGLGLVVIDVKNLDASRWTMQSVASQEDGLPALQIDAFASAPQDGLLWIGTTRGVGALQLNRIETPPLAQLTVQLNAEAQSKPVPDGGELRAGSSDLFIRPVLVTNHREYDTRYRVHLHRDGEENAPFDSLSLSASDTTGWISEPEARYRSLSPGRYSLRVWARDYAGRTVASPVTHFRVVPQLWRTWWAILLYAAFIVVAVYLAHRWRLRTLERTNLQLANSERKMRASERKFRALFDEASSAHLLIDGSRVTSMNTAARLLLGMSAETLSDGEADDSMPDVQAVLPPAIARDIASLAESGVMQEYLFHMANGTEIPLSAQISQVPLDDRTLWHLVLCDLRAQHDAEVVRLRLEDQVRDAQKFESLGTLAGGVAHDFNNLLGVIRGNVELARDTLHDADAVASHLDTVFDASERARDLVRQILTFSRRSTTREECVDLARLTRELQPMLRSMIPTSVHIAVSGVERPLFVQGDSTQLQQILLNLSSNAEYAMRANGGGRLRIALDSFRDELGETPSHTLMVRLRVSDSGIGMAPEVVERVFEPFYTTKPTGEGTGLGMAVLHGIVASHGGRVRVISVPNKGTTFEIMLPLAPESSVAAFDLVGGVTAGATATNARTVNATTPVAKTSDVPAHAAAVAIRPGTLRPDGAPGIHIVMVDDEPAVARVGESALTRMGYYVTVFADPAIALAFVRAAPGDVDLVVTDQTMPGLTGDVLASELRKIRADLPVIIMSGFSYVLTAERLAEVGARMVLQKPVGLAALRAAVEEVLEGVVAAKV